jgi:hypothetical protein
MADSLEQLVEKLTKAHGGDLVSVILYGSAAVGDKDEKYSDLNVLCVLKEIGPAQMRCAEPVFRWWREQGNPSPLLLTEHEVRTSTDCFAIEFLDIKQHHRILHGSDVVSDLVIDDSFYRAQVEHELRAKLLRLRQKASGVLSDKNILRNLLVDSFSTFCVLFRHALHLHGDDAATSRKRDVIEASISRFGLDGSALRTLIDLREERTKAGDMDAEMLLAIYLKDIGRVIDAVDVLDKGE